ncbi:MAG TPA: AsmA family protein [Noviherbaspirillum sp.]|jgi:AsmA protein|uniref:AsmA family protein n=1 Tax=Noviherbaspirillum sp. TaxID=1926288 RepID=UPI002DDCC519|nr:AsmA family protein [Noviherbaspirillum sp.]HEV2612195.1 AsmA family protein [Noviherbaspirillum sp.]
MPKIARRIAIGIAALLAVVLAAAAILAATFDPNDYKPQLIQLVQDRYQRTLTIPGDVRLRLFPRIAADLGPAAISERGGAERFAAVDGARLSLALLPLFSRQFVVDHVRIDGLRANIRRGKDGSTNFDDLLGKDAPPAREAVPPQTAAGNEVGFDIDSVQINDAQIRIDDRQQNRRIELANLDIRSGRIADGVPGTLHLTADVKSDKPDIDVQLAIDSGFAFHLGPGRYQVTDLDARIKGRMAGIAGLVATAAGNADLSPSTRRFTLDGIRVTANGKHEGRAIDVKFDIPKLAVTDEKMAGGKVNGEARLVQGARTLTATFAAPSFDGSPQSFRLPEIMLEATAKDAGLDAKVKLAGALSGSIDKLLLGSPRMSLQLSGSKGGTAIDGALTTPFSASFETMHVDLPNIEGNFTLPNPAGGALAFKTAGNARINLDKKTMTTALKGSLDDSAYDARLGLSRFSPPAYTFDIGIDRLDLDRYKRKPSPQRSVEKGGPPAKPAAEEPVDLSALRTLQADGNLRIGSLKASGIRASDVRMALKARNGKADIDPIAARLYGGSAAGALSVMTGNPAHVAIRQNLTGIDVGPLLKDALGGSRVEGRSNVRLDVAGKGMAFGQIRKSLDGNAAVELRDGSVRGVNIAQAVRNAKAKIGELRGDAPPQSGTAAAGDKTDFSELSGTFRIAGGIARNDDLSIKSPLIRVSGAGEINLGEERIDYLAKTTVVSTLEGQGGPELQALKGLTIPVRLSGPFDAIGWRIDVAGMASELARQKLDEKREEIKSKAQKALEGQKGKVEERLKEGLRGLLGK